MPVDAMGTYRHNHESAAMHSKAAGNSYAPKEESEHQDSGNMTEVHNHGDGTFHTVHDSEEQQHESIGHMHAHLSKIHGEEGHKHFHAHHDGVMHTSHSVHSGEEPDHRQHDSEEGVNEHLSEHLGGDGGEPTDGNEPESAAAGDGKGLSGLY